MEKTKIESLPPRKRAKRTPINGRNILTVTNKDPAYVYRIVNDVGDRVKMFEERDWECVPESDVQVGDRRIQAASSVGSLAQATVDKSGSKAYVMRIRKEYYDEDQTAKLEHIAKQEETMKQSVPSTGDYGKFELSK